MIGPAGQEVKSSGDLLGFFDDIRRWYGHDPAQMSEIEWREFNWILDRIGLRNKWPNIP